MEYEVRVTEEFVTWATSLRDPKAKAAVATRIARAQIGNFGDSKSVGGSVRELRIPVGKGYRVYFTVRGRRTVFLLVGGHKGTQNRDIERAKAIAKEL